MAQTMRVEANLPETYAACAFYSQRMTRKCLTLKMKVRVMEYNMRMVPCNGK